MPVRPMTKQLPTAGLTPTPSASSAAALFTYEERPNLPRELDRLANRKDLVPTDAALVLLHRADYLMSESARTEGSGGPGRPGWRCPAAWREQTGPTRRAWSPRPPLPLWSASALPSISIPSTIVPTAFC